MSHFFFGLILFRNLQAAICSYYDIEQPTVELPSMTVVDDVTIGEGESVPPNTKFCKTWRIQNSGKLLLRWLSGVIDMF